MKLYGVVVESNQGFNDWYFGFSCTVQPSLLPSVAAKTFKDLMKSLCVVQLLQKEASIYTLYLFYFIFCWSDQPRGLVVRVSDY